VLLRLELCSLADGGRQETACSRWPGLMWISLNREETATFAGNTRLSQGGACCCTFTASRGEQAGWAFSPTGFVPNLPSPLHPASEATWQRLARGKETDSYVCREYKTIARRSLLLYVHSIAWRTGGKEDLAFSPTGFVPNLPSPLHPASEATWQRLARGKETKRMPEEDRASRTPFTRG
jgi:hypothetical protein